MKKAVALLAGILLLCAFCFQVWAEDGTMVITASTVSGNPGDTVEVTLDVSGNYEIWAVGFYIYYNQDALELQRVDNGEIFAAEGEWSAPSEDLIERDNARGWYKYHATLNGMSNTSVTGRLCTLVFNIKEDAATGSYPITMDLGRDCNIKWPEEDVPTDFIFGKVTVGNGPDADTLVTRPDQMMVDGGALHEGLDGIYGAIGATDAAAGGNAAQTQGLTGAGAAQVTGAADKNTDQSRPTDASADDSPQTVLLVVVAVLAAAMIVVVAVVITARKKTRQKQSDTPGEQQSSDDQK